MKLRHAILVILGSGILFLSPIYAFAQKTLSAPVEVIANNRNLKEILTSLQKNTELQFIYNDKIVSAYNNISINARNKPLSTVLTEILSSTNLHYIIQNDKIIITENESRGKQMGASISFQESFPISGIVKDEKGAAIAGALVFLSKTRKIVTTGEDGKFNLGPLDPGKYEVVVNMLGFYPFRQIIYIQYSPVNLGIALKENRIALNPVVIKAGKADPRKQQYLSLFRQYFIGESNNSGETEIVNPEVLNFRYVRRKDMLEASAGTFLIIDNHSLGYRVNYLISKFELYLKSNIIFYEGSPYFEEMEGSEAQKKQWEINRESTYKGSVKHFFTSVFTNCVESEGFLVYQVPARKVLKKSSAEALEKIRPVKIDSVFTPLNKDFRQMKLKLTGRINGKSVNSRSEKLNIYPFYIVYTKEKEPLDFIASGRHITFPLNKKISATSQISTIQPLSNNILVDKNGGFMAESFLFKGYWTWENMADMLPLDYSPQTAAFAENTVK